MACLLKTIGDTNCECRWMEMDVGSIISRNGGLYGTNLQTLPSPSVTFMNNQHYPNV